MEKSTLEELQSLGKRVTDFLDRVEEIKKLDPETELDKIMDEVKILRALIVDSTDVMKLAPFYIRIPLKRIISPFVRTLDQFEEAANKQLLAKQQGG